MMPRRASYAVTSNTVEDHIFTDEEIRDVLAHNSAVSDCGRFDLIAVFVDNALDEAVSVQVMGNRQNSIVGAVTIGAAFNVAATDQESRTVDPTNAGYLPYIYIVVTAAIAPANGELNAYILKRVL